MAHLTIGELRIADDPSAWRAAGFTVDDDGISRVGTVRLRIDPSLGDASPGSPSLGNAGIVGWSVRGVAASVTDIDGLPTNADRSDVDDPDEHPLGLRSIDHLVVTTPDLPRTVAAVEALGLELKRTREGESYGRPVRQAFFRMGEVILEIVGGPEPDGQGGPARFFGLACTATSLPAAAQLLGPDRISDPKPAVQPGRHIATLRSAAGLKVAVALMD